MVILVVSLAAVASAVILHAMTRPAERRAEVRVERRDRRPRR